MFFFDVLTLAVSKQALYYLNMYVTVYNVGTMYGGSVYLSEHLLLDYFFYKCLTMIFYFYSFEGLTNKSGLTFFLSIKYLSVCVVVRVSVQMVDCTHVDQYFLLSLYL